MTLSIIIVNYNVYELLKNCIKSVNAIVTGIEYEIIVIDNNSPDRDIDSILLDFPYVKYLTLENNLGFAKANNKAAKAASGKYILFLNPDTLITDNFIPYFIKQLEDNKDAAICAPQLVYSDNSYQSSTGPPMGLFYDFLEAYGLIGVYRSQASKKYLSEPDCFYKVGWVSAACFLISREMFEYAGGFTEIYFLNYEDIDLCHKIRGEGFDIFYFPKYKCTHLDHKSFDTNYELLVYSRYSGRLVFLKLYFGSIKYALSFLIIITGILLKLLVVNFVYSNPERAARRRGYWRALKMYTGIE